MGIWRWFAFPQTSPAFVDFHSRFNVNYIRSKCYHSATFEILESRVVTEHHHHHHHHHNIQHCGCGCGGLVSLFVLKHGSSWLHDLFAEKDDVEWLTTLLEKKEITEEQYKWLLELFESKPEIDGQQAEKWWRSIFTSKYSGSFDKSSIPEWVREHFEK